MPTIGILSLGCSRNLVDSEVMLGILKKSGFRIAEDNKCCDILVINTCAFIKSAREEAVHSVLEAAHLKKEGKIKHLVVCGCLPQLYKDELSKELPEVDLFLGTSDIVRIQDFIKDINKDTKRNLITGKLNYLYNDHSPRLLLTPKHYAYVKISEGCDNRCSYCIISRLRGKFRSRDIKSVVNEVKELSREGALKEINLVGQDTTLFGMDRYGKPQLPRLLKKLCGLNTSVRWIRLLYTHPAHYNKEIIGIVRDEDRICKYLDIPIQHINDGILKKMNRRVRKKDIIRLIDYIRQNVPGIVLRTSIIAGFPGEGDKEFKELLDFLKDTGFDKLGAFTYSKEDGTPAARFKDQVPEKVKKSRLDEIMKLQAGISSSINKNYIGRIVEVLIDEKCDGQYIGRTQGDAPEVDGSVYVKGEGLKTGEFCKVKITDALEYDLTGEKAE